MSDNQKWSILQGDALKVLGTFAPTPLTLSSRSALCVRWAHPDGENKSTARSIPAWARTHRPFDRDAEGPALLDPLGGGVVV